VTVNSRLVSGYTLLPNWIHLEPELSTSAKCMLTLLYTYAGRRRSYCFPSEATLALSIGLGIKQISRLLSLLEKAGHIRRIRRGKTLSNMYVISQGDWTPMPDHNSGSGQRDRTPASAHRTLASEVVRHTRDNNSKINLEKKLQKSELTNSRENQPTEPFSDAERGANIARLKLIIAKACQGRTSERASRD
jgi:hypothetical protein